MYRSDSSTVAVRPTTFGIRSFRSSGMTTTTRRHAATSCLSSSSSQDNYCDDWSEAIRTAYAAGETDGILQLVAIATAAAPCHPHPNCGRP